MKTNGLNGYANKRCCHSLATCRWYSTISAKLRPKKEQAGVSRDQNVWISLRKDGRVRSSGKGSPPWQRFVRTLPPDKVLIKWAELDRRIYANSKNVFVHRALGGAFWTEWMVASESSAIIADSHRFDLKSKICWQRQNRPPYSQPARGSCIVRWASTPNMPTRS